MVNNNYLCNVSHKYYVEQEGKRLEYTLPNC
jgi:hypothetical protein